MNGAIEDGARAAERPAAGDGPRMGRLSTFIAHANAAHVPQVHAADLDRDRFYRDFVRRARPCVIRQGAGSWSLISDFSIEFLRSRSRADDVISRVIGRPLDEYSREEREGTHKTHMRYHEFLNRLATDDDEYLQAYGVGCEGPLSCFRGSQLTRRLLPGDTPRARRYRERLFLYKNGFTDWHWHSEDETLTLQISGTKLFVLLGLDSTTFHTMTRRPPCSSHVPVLRPLVTVVEPGDVIYIPVYWWHAAAADGVGATLASTFGSPWPIAGDLRLSAARAANGAALRNALRMRRWRPMVYVCTRVLSAALLNTLTARRYDQ